MKLLEGGPHNKINQKVLNQLEHFPPVTLTLDLRP